MHVDEQRTGPAGVDAKPAVFARDTEREAYRLLHREGLAAFDAAYPRWGTDLINRWDGRGLVRARWDGAGCFHVRTFAKYVNATVAR